MSGITADVFLYGVSLALVLSIQVISCQLYVNSWGTSDWAASQFNSTDLSFPVAAVSLGASRLTLTNHHALTALAWRF